MHAGGMGPMHAAWGDPAARPHFWHGHQDSDTFAQHAGMYAQPGGPWRQPGYAPTAGPHVGMYHAEPCTPDAAVMQGLLANAHRLPAPALLRREVSASIPSPLSHMYMVFKVGAAGPAAGAPEYGSPARSEFESAACDFFASTLHVGAGGSGVHVRGQPGSAGYAVCAMFDAQHAPQRGAMRDLRDMRAIAVPFAGARILVPVEPCPAPLPPAVVTVKLLHLNPLLAVRGLGAALFGALGYSVQQQQPGHPLPAPAPNTVWVLSEGLGKPRADTPFPGSGNADAVILQVLPPSDDVLLLRVPRSVSAAGELDVRIVMDKAGQPLRPEPGGPVAGFAPGPGGAAPPPPAPRPPPPAPGQPRAPPPPPAASGQPQRSGEPSPGQPASRAPRHAPDLPTGAGGPTRQAGVAAGQSQQQRRPPAPGAGATLGPQLRGIASRQQPRTGGAPGTSARTAQQASGSAAVQQKQQQQPSQQGQQGGKRPKMTPAHQQGVRPMSRSPSASGMSSSSAGTAGRGGGSRGSSPRRRSSRRGPGPTARGGSPLGTAQPWEASTFSTALRGYISGQLDCNPMDNRVRMVLNNMFMTHNKWWLKEFAGFGSEDPAALPNKVVAGARLSMHALGYSFNRNAYSDGGSESEEEGEGGTLPAPARRRGGGRGGRR